VIAAVNKRDINLRVILRDVFMTLLPVEVNLKSGRILTVNRFLLFITSIHVLNAIRFGHTEVRRIFDYENALREPCG